METECCVGYESKGACNINVEQLIQDCVYDLCFDGPTTTQQEQVLCESQLIMAESCRNNYYDITGYLESPCLPECPSYSSYLENGNICDKSTSSCNSEELFCPDSTPIDGCFCDEGYLWSNEAYRCVSISLCPVEVETCDTSSPIYTRATAYSMVIENEVSINFASFDGQQSFVKGGCETGYTLSKACSDDLNDFSVDVGYTNTSTTLTISYTLDAQTIKVMFNTAWATVRYQITNSVGVTGQIQSLLYGANINSFGIGVRGTQTSGKIYFGAEGFTTTNGEITDPFEFMVQVSQLGDSFLITMEASCVLSDSICGIFGNLNSELADDLRYPGLDGESFDPWLDDYLNDIEYVYSNVVGAWSVDELCPNPEIVSCTVDDKTTFKAYCDTVVNSVIGSSGCTPDLTSIKEACVQLICPLSETDYSSILCEVANVVASMCQESTLDDWRNTENLMLTSDDYEIISCPNTLVCSENESFSACVEEYICSGMNVYECQAYVDMQQSEIDSLSGGDGPCNENVSKCTAGCKCDPGYIRNGYQCVKLQDFCPVNPISQTIEPVCNIKASIFGNGLNYHQFDGSILNFGGECQYTNSKLCDSDDVDEESGMFDFHQYSEILSETSTIGRSSFEVTISDTIYTFTTKPLQLGWKLSINSSSEETFLESNVNILDNLVVRAGDGDIAHVYVGGSETNLQRLPNNYALHVMHQFESEVITIEIGCQYADKVCGLLGNADATSGSLRKPDGSQASSTDIFGDSWLYDPNNVCSTTTTSTEDSTDSCDLEAAESVCREYLNADSVSCGNVETYVSTCATNWCKSASHSNACQLAGHVAYECSLLQFNRANWRNSSQLPQPCDIDCPSLDANMIYYKDRKSCVKTVDNCNTYDPTAACDNVVPVSGCFCNEDAGYMFDPLSQQCENQCPEVDECKNGAAVSNFYAQAQGDPHIYSFDGARIDFQGCGDYVLTQNCSGSDTPYFKVITRQEHLNNAKVTYRVILLECQIQGAEMPNSG